MKQADEAKDLIAFMQFCFQSLTAAFNALGSAEEDASANTVIASKEALDRHTD